jgi:ABC-type glutathione transport system ATPase component
MKVLDLVKEPLDNYKLGSKEERLARAKVVLQRVGLHQGLWDRYPHELSGGQCQRAALARALVLDPELVFFDEAVTSLDVPSQVQIIRLIKKLNQQAGFTYLFVSHDIDVIKHLCSRIIVLHKGEIFESGNVKDVYESPSHPYTQVFLSKNRR